MLPLEKILMPAVSKKRVPAVSYCQQFKRFIKSTFLGHAVAA